MVVHVAVEDGAGGGYCLYKCMATHIFVSVTMHHIQHMVPSSSPFGAQWDSG